MDGHTGSFGHDRSARSIQRDTRGRGLRGVLMPRLPRQQTRSEKFDSAVLDVYADVLDLSNQHRQSLVRCRPNLYEHHE